MKRIDEIQFAITVIPFEAAYIVIFFFYINASLVYRGKDRMVKGTWLS